jgi:hypothetical protein
MLAVLRDMAVVRGCAGDRPSICLRGRTVFFTMGHVVIVELTHSGTIPWSNV